MQKKINSFPALAGSLDKSLTPLFASANATELPLGMRNFKISSEKSTKLNCCNNPIINKNMNITFINFTNLKTSTCEILNMNAKANRVFMQDAIDLNESVGPKKSTENIQLIKKKTRIKKKSLE